MSSKRRLIGAVLGMGLVMSPALLLAQDTVSVTTDTTVTRHIIALEDTTFVTTIVIQLPPIVVPPDTTPPGEGFTVVATDDTLAYIVGIWDAAVDAQTYRYRAWDSAATDCPNAAGEYVNCNTNNMLTGNDDAVSGDTLLVPLQSLPIVATLLVDHFKTDGSFGGLLTSGSEQLPPVQGSIVLPPDSTPQDTTTPPPGGAAPHIKVPTDHTGAGPNEPAGFTPMGWVDYSQGVLVFRKVDQFGRGIYDHSQSDAIVQSGGNSRGTLIDDGGVQVLELRFPQGCMGLSGTSCGNNIKAGTRDAVAEQYAVMRTKVSSNYWVNKSGNKAWGPRMRNNKNLFHLRQYPASGSAHGASAPMNVQVGFGPKLCGVDKNYFSNVPFPRDQWVVWEVYVKHSSGSCSSDGVLKVWLNGVLAINQTGVNTYDVNGTPGPGDTLGQGVNVSPIFGGSCNATLAPCPSENTWIRYANIYISGR